MNITDVADVPSQVLWDRDLVLEVLEVKTSSRRSWTLDFCMRNVEPLISERE